MAIPHWLRFGALTDIDALADKRQRIVLPASLAGALVAAVLGANDVREGQTVIGVTVLLVSLALLIDVLAVRMRRPAPVPFGIVVLLIAFAVVLSVARQGVQGVLWGYPVALICYFVVTRRAAVVLSLLLLLALTTAVAVWVSLPMAARVFGSLLLTVVMVNVVFNVIADLQATLVQQTVTDALTGAYNRRHLDHTLAQAVELGRRREPANALLMIDIDHFKHVNDRLGHDGGDEVLRQLVRLLHARLRRTDMVFRMGGEEFVALLHDTDAASGMAVAESLRGLVERAALLPGLAITISIGVCVQGKGRAAEQWLKAADLALYRAKNGGRNRVELAAAEGVS